MPAHPQPASVLLPPPPRPPSPPTHQLPHRHSSTCISGLQSMGLPACHSALMVSIVVSTCGAASSKQCGEDTSQGRCGTAGEVSPTLHSPSAAVSGYALCGMESRTRAAGAGSCLGAGLSTTLRDTHAWCSTGRQPAGCTSREQCWRVPGRQRQTPVRRSGWQGAGRGPAELLTTSASHARRCAVSGRPARRAASLAAPHAKGVLVERYHKRCCECRTWPCKTSSLS